ncbi:MAG: c-type cytochrome domain-containing protein [Limisphaerales bacterium]
MKIRAIRVFQSMFVRGLPFLFLTICPASYAAETQKNSLPPPANVKIEFDRDIRPIFETSCVRCHGPQKPHSRFRLDNRESALKGGDENTNDIVPGDSSKSLLIHYVARQVQDMEMPPPGRGAPLTPQQIGLLRAWIDQGANWNTTNQTRQLAFTFAPTLRWFDVHGDKAKFRELEGVNDGFSGGVKKFSLTQQSGPNESLSASGHFLFPNRDVKLQLALDETDFGFIHGGFENWRKYYDDTGGYNSMATPSEFNLNRDLYVDNGRIWIDFGLTPPRLPQIVLGYEYDYKNGDKSMLDWGYANGKNIYPAMQAMDEQTHIVKLNATYDFDDWHLENNARVEFYSEKNQSDESSIFSGGDTPDTFITTRDNYHHVQGMDTLMLEKQIRDWWFLSGGFYYSRLEGNDFFNQTTAIPAFSFANTLSSQQITLRRESEIFSVASLFTPLEYLTFSLGTQNEWARQEGFGDSVPDLELGGTVPANSDLGEFKASQSANFRFTKIPFTVIFGDARLSEDNYNVSQSENPDEFASANAAENIRYDLKTGFSASPWRWFDLSAQYERQDSDTAYNQLTDVFKGISGQTNGYPAFILNRDIRSDGFETKLALRPAIWLKTTLTYQITSTDYSSKTDPAFDAGLMQAVSPGGPILDGQYDAQTYGLNVTLTPWARFYFSGAFTYSESRAVTSDNGDPSIAPYRGDIYTVTATATYALNLKTGLQAAYIFSRADYGQNNSADGVPLGLDFTRHQLILGLTRQITKRLAGALHYEFSEYSEPGSGGANDFTAQGIFATLAYKWP